ncbi:unnamed protein product [Rotaria magnacalcarata]|uniref:Argonaute linker 1 domain-containing protein n=1 Tax=Rotaria magnacalcarata TaxID=392030 RepID=A0A816Y880_9BILA|nr:unnamed protein product [Rotaria magnacalcarata]
MGAGNRTGKIGGFHAVFITWVNLRKKEYQCEINDKNTGQTNRFRFLILNLVKIYTLKTMFDFIQNKISIKPHGLVKSLESLFKQTQRSDLITIKNQSYRKHQRFDDLGDAIGLASGFYQSIVLCERGLTLNINKSFVSFYQNYNLVQFLSCYMGRDIQKNGISSKDQALLVEKILKFLWFIILYQEDDCQYRLKSFGCPANQHKYIINGNEPLTAVNYFNDRWQIPLRYPHLPVVELYHPNDNNRSYTLPMELVAVDEGQPNLQAITTEQHIEAIRKTLVHPDKCHIMIQRVVDERRFDHDSYLQKFGITVDVNEMLRIPGRILPSPEIKYKLSDINQHDIIEGVMSKHGVQFNSSPIEKYDAAILPTMLARMNELKMLRCEVIIDILDQVGDEMYNAVKQLAKIKIVKKLNILLDDCHQLIPLVSSLNSPTSRSDVFMFFGIGYTHIAFSSERASIAFICGSTDSTNSK